MYQHTNTVPDETTIFGEAENIAISEQVFAHAYRPLQADDINASLLATPDAERWVNWRFLFDEKSDQKQRKVLCMPNGRLAKTTEPYTWSTFSKVVEAQDCFEGIGIVFDGTMLGVDFDNCIENGKITDPSVEEFVSTACTYTELSPSGTGLHALFHLTAPLQLERNRSGNYECYTEGRYFTFTSTPWGAPQTVRAVAPEGARELLQLIGYPWEQKAPVETSIQSNPIQNEPAYQSPQPDDDQLLEKAFASKNGDKLKALFDGDISAYNSNSEADLALCLRLAFWTGKDEDRMDRIFRTTKLMRPKWDEKRHRTTYGRITIAQAVKRCTDVYTGRSQATGVAEDFLMSSGTKNTPPYPKLVFENICRVVERDDSFRGLLRLNEFSDMVEMYNERTKKWVMLSDGFIFEAMRHVSVSYPFFVDVNKGMMTDAIITVAHKNRANPPKDYIHSLEWDGIPRLDSWLHHAYGVPDDTIHREIGANWMKGLVSRIMRPGCQYDHVLVLESEQGWKKSSSLRVLGEPWHVEINVSPDNKDFFMMLAQNVIVEFSEGDVLSRTDVKKLKGVITKVEDQFRPPYGRGIVMHKRGCVFAMTTNDTDYLKDETGNRRWLPVRLEKIADIEWLKQNRDQLYAEAYHRIIELNETTYEYSDEELLKEMQESRRERNDYEEDLIIWYLGLKESTRSEGIRAIDVYNKVVCPGSYTSDFTKEVPHNTQRVISRMLRGALFLENKNVKRNNVVSKRWMPTEQTISKLGLKDGETNNTRPSTERTSPNTKMMNLQ